VTLSGANKQVIWSSATAGGKTTTIGNAASAVVGQDIDVATTLGNGDLHTIVPNGSDTIGDASGATGTTYQFYDASVRGTNIGLRSDGVSNWVIR
jgi:hypothetical protein